MKILILDNYDSFTWNLVHGFEAAGAQCLVHRSDSLTVADIGTLGADRIVLSPGPFDPSRAGICGDVVGAYGGSVPILGVCLGMQVIATVFGAEVVESGRPVHGRTSPVHHDGLGVFRGLPSPFEAARYHSLVVRPESVPGGLIVSARAAGGAILGVRSNVGRVEGVMFHPESFLTEHGPRILANFLEA